MTGFTPSDKPYRLVWLTRSVPCVRTTGRPCIISRPPRPTAEWTPATNWAIFAVAATIMLIGMLVILFGSHLMDYLSIFL